MNEIMELAKSLKGTPDLFPWVCLAIVLIFLYKERDTVREFIQSMIESRKEEARYHAQYGELVRNNTAALENNTMALELVKKDRDAVVKAVETHEAMNAERMQHIQEVINRIDRTTSGNKENISIIADRTWRNEK